MSEWVVRALEREIDQIHSLNALHRVPTALSAGENARLRVKHHQIAVLRNVIPLLERLARHDD